MPSPVDPPSLSTLAHRHSPSHSQFTNSPLPSRSFSLHPSVAARSTSSLSSAPRSVSAAYPHLSSAPPPPLRPLPSSHQPHLTDDVSALLKTEEFLADSYSIIPVVKDLISLVLHPPAAKSDAQRRTSAQRGTNDGDAYLPADGVGNLAKEDDEHLHEKDPLLLLHHHRSEESLRPVNHLPDTHRKPRCVSCVDLKHPKNNSKGLSAAAEPHAEGAPGDSTRGGSRTLSWNMSIHRRPADAAERKDENPHLEPVTGPVVEDFPAPKNRALSFAAEADDGNNRTARRRLSWNVTVHRKPSSATLTESNEEKTTPVTFEASNTDESAPRPTRRLSLFERRRPSKLGGGLAGFGFPSK